MTNWNTLVIWPKFTVTINFYHDCSQFQPWCSRFITMACIIMVECNRKLYVNGEPWSIELLLILYVSSTRSKLAMIKNYYFMLTCSYLRIHYYSDTFYEIKSKKESLQNSWDTTYTRNIMPSDVLNIWTNSLLSFCIEMI